MGPDGLELQEVRDVEVAPRQFLSRDSQRNVAATSPFGAPEVGRGQQAEDAKLAEFEEAFPGERFALPTGIVGSQPVAAETAQRGAELVEVRVGTDRLPGCHFVSCPSCDEPCCSR